MIYYITFFVTGFCAYEAKKGKKLFAYILIGWMIVLAGLRSETVGTDVLVYGNSLFESARTSDFSEYMFNNYNWYGIEPLYLLMTYFVSLVTSNVHILYFLIEFIIVGLVLSRLMQLEHPQSVLLGMFIFQCLFIGETFNLMRQSIAMAIIFFATQYFERRQYVRYLILVVIATGFHSTAIVGLLLLFIYLLLQKKNNMWIHLLIVMGSCVITFFYNEVLSKMIEFGIFSEKYSRYVNTAEGGFDFNIIILRLPILLLIFLFYKKYQSQDRVTNSFLVDILILEIILAELRVLSDSIYRISLYLGYFKILAYPKLEEVLKKRTNKLIVMTLVILYCLIVFYYQIIIQGNNEIYPYETYLLK